MDSQDDRIM